VLAAALAGCAIGPDYRRPAAPVPPAFKEAEGWKISAPRDDADRGPWWTIFGDPVLNDLAPRVAASNQNLKAFEAAYRQALAAVAQSRASLFPTAGANGAFTRSERGSGQTTVRTGAGGAPVAVATGPSNQYSASFGGSWDIDVWGRIRRTLEASKASAQASAADLANATLSAQAQLVTAYFELRVQDEAKRLLDQTAEGYAESYQIARNKYAQGVVSKADLSQAETQLRNTQVQALGAQQQRDQLEHAIAVLIGEAPAHFNLAPVPFAIETPDVPVGVPSTLLERRPDVAAAERRVAAANAQIGVAISAFFPDVTVTGSYGYSNSSLDTLFQASNRSWSVGPQLALSVFDAGARLAQVRRARGAYDQEVAAYRQTVLTAMLQVEDQLTAVSALAEQAAIQADAVAAARDAQRIVRNQYKAGTVDFTTVASAQATALASEQSALGIRRSQLTAAVALIQALGGGWTGAQLAGN
jgi:NodT family efflux transporter outer membrane factor (OMF) lipoprotein